MFKYFKRKYLKLPYASMQIVCRLKPCLQIFFQNLLFRVYEKYDRCLQSEQAENNLLPLPLIFRITSMNFISKSTISAMHFQFKDSHIVEEWMICNLYFRRCGCIHHAEEILSRPPVFNEYSDERLSFTEMSPSIFCSVYNRFMRLILLKAPQSSLTIENGRKNKSTNKQNFSIFSICLAFVEFCGPFSQCP